MVAVISLIVVIYINDSKGILVFSIFLIAIAALLTVLVVIKNVLTFPKFINIEEKIISDLNILVEDENKKVIFFNVKYYEDFGINMESAPVILLAELISKI